MIRQDFLTPNEYSRPGNMIKMGTSIILKKVEGLVFHWVENPGTSAQFNRNWFEARKDGNHGYGSAEYIVDHSEIIQCMPNDEIAFHVGAGPFPSSRYTATALREFRTYPSARTIGIELCHPDWTGRFEPEVLWRAIWLGAGLCLQYDLDPFSDCWRHFDITEKNCPKYWVKHPNGFTEFKRDMVQAHSRLAAVKARR